MDRNKEGPSNSCHQGGKKVQELIKNYDEQWKEKSSPMHTKSKDLKKQTRPGVPPKMFDKDREPPSNSRTIPKPIEVVIKHQPSRPYVKTNRCGIHGISTQEQKENQDKSLPPRSVDRNQDFPGGGGDIYPRNELMRSNQDKRDTQLFKTAKSTSDVACQNCPQQNTTFDREQDCFTFCCQCFSECCIQIMACV